MQRVLTAALLATLLGGLAPGLAAEQAPLAPLTHAQGFVPVDSVVVERAVTALLATWNSPGFSALLAPDFPNRERLLAALARAPVGARLELLGLGGIQTLEQTRGPGQMLSLVRASARIVLLYDDTSGPHRREGTVELVLRVTRQAPR